VNTHSIDKSSKFDQLLLEFTDRPQTTHLELGVDYLDDVIGHHRRLGCTTLLKHLSTAADIMTHRQHTTHHMTAMTHS